MSMLLVKAKHRFNIKTSELLGICYKHFIDSNTKIFDYTELGSRAVRSFTHIDDLFANLHKTRLLGING